MSETVKQNPNKVIMLRGGIFLAVLLIGFLALGGRMFQLQYYGYEKFAKSASGYIASKIGLAARRGNILDSRGRAVAVSRKVRSCAFDPKIADDKGVGREKVIEALRGALSLEPVELDKIYKVALRKKSRFVWIKRKLTDEQYKKTAELKLAGVIFPEEYKREYPQKETASQVVGFGNIDGKGQEGVERVCDSILRGVDGSREVMRDAAGRKLMTDSGELLSANQGLDVELTIDSYIQSLAESELKNAVEEFGAKSGTVVALDPLTGDIMAMASYPWYDPNTPVAFPVENRLNAGIASQFEPGSIFKPFVVAGALESGAVTPRTKFNCEGGAWKMPNSSRVLHDAHGYGTLSTEMILVKSSNIGTAKLAGLLGKKQLYDYVKAFGFGSKTGVPLSGELKGKVYPLKKWTEYSMGSVPMGHEISVTPIQVVAAYGALANGGVLLRPRLIKRVLDTDGRVVNNIPIKPLRRVISQKVAGSIMSMLGKTVSVGTGKKAKLREYAVGGKTGTANLAVNKEEYLAGERGYSQTRYIGSFVGVAPVENPRIVVMVSIREPKKAHYGGTVAAPAVGKIIKGSLRYLKVPVKNAVTLAQGGRR